MYFKPSWNKAIISKHFSFSFGAHSAVSLARLFCLELMHKNDINFDHLHWNRKLTCARNSILFVHAFLLLFRLRFIIGRVNDPVPPGRLHLAEAIKEITKRRANSFNQTNDVRFAQRAPPLFVRRNERLRLSAALFTPSIVVCNLVCSLVDLR